MRELYTLTNELNNILNGVNTGFIPVDVIKKDNAINVLAVLPGFKKEEIEISFLDNALTIKTNKDLKKDEAKYLVKEFANTNLERTIRFRDINAEEITASIENGILNITISLAKPKAKSVIEIK